MTELAPARRIRLAVFKLASCDGCQLQLVDAALALAERAGGLELVHFPEVTASGDGPFDIALVEGSVSTPGHIDELLHIREQSRFLVTIGACATAGGVQALRNAAAADESLPTFYAAPAYVRSLATSTPVAEHVNVDLEVHGCPVDAGQLLGALAALAAGSVPRLPGEPVCVECKRRGYACVMVAKGEPCLGPVSRTGCGALCPSLDRGCYGCFGPADTTNTRALTGQFRRFGLAPGEVAVRFRTVTSAAPAFEAAASEAER